MENSIQPAFAVSKEMAEMSEITEYPYGLTKREYFAAKAMQGYSELDKLVKKLQQADIISSVCSCDNVHGEIETKTNYCWYCLKSIKEQTDL